MKYLVASIAALCFPLLALCQDITGLWKGTLINDSSKQPLQYEIFISKKHGRLSGFSQTWFLIDEKLYYGIKKINVRFAKDGKIVIQEGALVENNYPLQPNKNVIQLNVLNLVSNKNETLLEGLFVTNSSKSYTGLTGKITITKAAELDESSLMKYLQKNNASNDVTALK